jgi:2-keto-4-pentenoate hydratase
MSDEANAAAYERLMAAESSGVPCEPIRELIGASDIAAAYAVQERITASRLAAGRRLVGRKIGLTALTVQKQLGVDQPDYGMLFDNMDVPSGSDVPAGMVMQPRCEAEIAFIMGDDLEDERVTTADVMRATEFVVGAIEIVGSRIAGWNIKIADTVADNASSGAFVLGHQPRRLTEIDVRTCGMVMERRGEPVSSGAGLACLGSPVNATVWLARTMARAGRPLRRGDIVLSGALGPMIPAVPGDFFEARIEGLGSISVGFAS